MAQWQWLETDHAKLRRWLVDTGLLERDGYGRVYDRVSLTELPANSQAVVISLCVHDPKAIAEACIEARKVHACRHFGSDASVSPQSLAMLETYFKTYGSNREKYKFAPGSLRISDSPWFQRKHRKQRLADAIGIRTTSIRAWSDCMQCHAQADTPMIQFPSLARRGETFPLFGVLPEIASA